ncbi:MAG: F0F1 ATP synthase subunit B [bacterium]|nr:F0F1 ATP synthase subunit B [bacterium]MDZ4296668.1 F0F1 ATP synthase subunit B [Patescibacteria group bacterium]
MSELTNHFGIDWKLLIAQAINFFVLLLVLKKFAFGPILKMLRARRQEIEKGLEFSKEAEENLRKSNETRERIVTEAKGEALSIVTEAENLAKERREVVLEEAVKKGEALQTEAKRAIHEEKLKMAEEVYHYAEDLVRTGIARVLGRIPEEERDNALIKEALRELKTVK